MLKKRTYRESSYDIDDSIKCASITNAIRKEMDSNEV